MQIQRVSYGVKGFVRLADYAIRWTRMITEKAKQRVKILAFWDKHGLDPAMEAFGVGRRTLFLWKSALKHGGGNLEALNPKSTKPHHARKRLREWPEEVIKEIRRLREEHPNLGKEKIHVFLKPFCETQKLLSPKPSTIGLLIKDLGGLRRFPVKVRHNGMIVPRKRVTRLRKPASFVATHPGQCVALDTVERIIHGSRRYVITFTDLASRFSLAWAGTSHASKAAQEFFDLTRFLFPFRLSYVLTDNGSEFLKHFDEALRELHLTHWHTYPKTPKMNAHAERFNRTIQEEYIDFHEPELLDTERFNIGLMKHLLWHNTERPHWSLKLKPPVQYIQETYSQQECKMYLTYTKNRQKMLSKVPFSSYAKTNIPAKKATSRKGSRVSCQDVSERGKKRAVSSTRERQKTDNDQEAIH